MALGRNDDGSRRFDRRRVLVRRERVGLADTPLEGDVADGTAP
jgi:hypothetical protein